MQGSAPVLFIFVLREILVGVILNTETGNYLVISFLYWIHGGWVTKENVERNLKGRG